MKTLNRRSFLALAAAFLVAPAAFGQVVTTQTTLSAALTSTQQTVCVASSTGISGPGFGNPALTGLFVDREFMIVNSATSNSLCWNVTRGFGGTAAFAHNTASVVWVGPTGGFGGSPFRNSDPQGGGGSPCVSTSQPYLPQITIGSSASQPGTIWSCPLTGQGANLWVGVKLPNSGLSGGGPYYVGVEGGANNALTIAVPGLTQIGGSCVIVKLGHTLQAGANTIALNGGTATALKSHFNIANNIATVYAATGTLNACFDGTQWTDMSQ